MLKLSVRALVFLAATPMVGACGAAPGEGAEESAQASAASSTSAAPLISFNANWTKSVSQPLLAGKPVEVAYDPARLVSQCGGDVTSGGGNGGFAWQITGYYLIGSSAPASFPVTITSAWASGNGSFTPATAGTLAIWFGCGNTTGNAGWDSNYGKNYDFTVTQATTPDAGKAGNGDATGTIVVQVVGDSVQGNAGEIPPDTIAGAPISGANVYDGPFEAGKLLCTTGSNGQCTATLSVGTHALDVFEETSDMSSIYSSGHSVTVGATPTSVAVHVAPNSVEIQANFNAGYGNALYITGETSYLGNWNTAYKAYFNSTLSAWTYSANLPIGAQYKFLLAPWVSGSSIAVTSAGVHWQQGANDVVTLSTPGPVVNNDVTPSF
jgi:hypothetical protein